jgi:hypothetical protein
LAARWSIPTAFGSDYLVATFGSLSKVAIFSVEILSWPGKPAGGIREFAIDLTPIN